jgi:hypothetical protein
VGPLGARANSSSPWSWVPETILQRRSSSARGAAIEPQCVNGALNHFGSSCNGPIAQRLEQGTHNPLVAGSNPAGPNPRLPLYGSAAERPLGPRGQKALLAIFAVLSRLDRGPSPEGKPPSTLLTPLRDRIERPLPLRDEDRLNHPEKRGSDDANRVANPGQEPGLSLLPYCCAYSNALMPPRTSNVGLMANSTSLSRRPISR